VPRCDLGGHASSNRVSRNSAATPGPLSATDTCNVAPSASNAISTAAGLRGFIRAACRALSTRLPTTVLTEIGSVTEDGTHESSETRRTMPYSCACSVFRHQQCLKVRI
jgi:hypothetical protein